MNVAEFLLNTKDPERLALRFLGADYTYGELRSAASNIARTLLRKGSRRGHRVILLGENSFFWVASYLGILWSGATCVPLPPGTLREELRYYLDHTEARFAIVPVPLLARHKEELKDIHVLTDQPYTNINADLNLTCIDSNQAAAAEWIAPSTVPDDLASLMFTSGSTGQPRGVMVSHGNIIANTTSIIQALQLTADDSMMAVLPFHYCFGTSLLHTHLRVGGTLVVDSRFAYPELILRRMQETSCTGFAGVPSHYQILLRNSSIRKKSFPALRNLQQAGGHLAPSFIRELREALPQAKLFVMYGQTEATARLACMPPEALDAKMGSIGKAIPGVRLRILNEYGKDVAPGEVGEIVADGPSITRGYWRAPEETRFTFRRNKLYTGDLATFDEDGFIYVVDRTKEFIKCGGKRVSCLQLEDTLLEFEALLEAAVVGIPDDVLGEAVKAFLVPRSSDEPRLAERVLEFCKTRMPPSLVPTEIVLLQSLPKSAAGKILRQELKSLEAESAADRSIDKHRGPRNQSHGTPQSGRTHMQTISCFSTDVLKIDPALEVPAIHEAIRDMVFRQLNRKGAVVGLSGGIDSSVTAALCAGALGQDRVFGLMMPENDSSSESVELGRLVAEHCGIAHTVEDLSPALTAIGCYERRDHAVRQLIPDYGLGWKSKIVLPSVLQSDGYSIFSVVAISPDGKEVRARMTADTYLGVVAATNFKQRARKMLEYYHSDRLQYAVAGTPNRLEYDQGFFVKLGDGAADFKPIAHLYKSQVYQIAEYLGIPQEIRRRPPTTDTYSMEQSQEEFYFSLPLAQMDLCLYGKNHDVSADEVASALGLAPEQVQRVYRQIDAKRNATRYLHCRPLLVSDVEEIGDSCARR